MLNLIILYLQWMELKDSVYLKELSKNCTKTYWSHLQTFFNSMNKLYVNEILLDYYSVKISNTMKECSKIFTWSCTAKPSLYSTCHSFSYTLVNEIHNQFLVKYIIKSVISVTEACFLWPLCGYSKWTM